MKQWIFVLTLLGLVSAPVFAAHTFGTKGPTKTAKQKTQEKITLNVPSMTCPVCPITVRKALEKVPGVSQVTVNFNQKTTTVLFNPSKTDAKALMKATQNVGYPSTVDNQKK